jgi:hypothetical protein
MFKMLGEYFLENNCYYSYEATCAHLQDCGSVHFMGTVKNFLRSLVTAEDSALRIKFIHCSLKIFILSLQKFPLI